MYIRMCILFAFSFLRLGENSHWKHVEPTDFYQMYIFLILFMSATTLQHLIGAL